VTVNVSNTSGGTGSGSQTIRVNAGGPAYTDPSGKVWSADTGSPAGQADLSTASIANTSTPALYQTARWNTGRLTYLFSVSNGTYTVTLKYAELYFTSPGQRVFDVTINGQKVLQGFDIVAQAGGPNRAVDRSFPITVTNGQITIESTSTVDDPTVNAIEIVPGGSVTSAAVRVNAGGPAYTDPSGNMWSADTGSPAGQADLSTASIANTSTPVLYQTARWNTGRLTYLFSVSNGTYTVRLKYAELYFTSPGQRVFDVTINGQKVLQGFDIVAQAGGPNRAVDRSFPITVTNGQITIESTSMVDDPTVNAIEITK